MVCEPNLKLYPPLAPIQKILEPPLSLSVLMNKLQVTQCYHSLTQRLWRAYCHGNNFVSIKVTVESGN